MKNQGSAQQNCKGKKIYKNGNWTILCCKESSDHPYTLLYKDVFVRRADSLTDLVNQTEGEDPTTFYTATQ